VGHCEDETSRGGCTIVEASDHYFSLHLALHGQNKNLTNDVVINTIAAASRRRKADCSTMMRCKAELFARNSRILGSED
jgi:hypothetical protein